MSRHDEILNMAYGVLTAQGYLPTSKIDRMAVVELVVTAVETTIRADERERIAVAIEAWADDMEWGHVIKQDAARIARNGGSDD